MFFQDKVNDKSQVFPWGEIATTMPVNMSFNKSRPDFFSILKNIFP